MYVLNPLVFAAPPQGRILITLIFQLWELRQREFKQLAQIHAPKVLDLVLPAAGPKQPDSRDKF